MKVSVRRLKPPNPQMAHQCQQDGAVEQRGGDGFTIPGHGAPLGAAQVGSTAVTS